MRPFVFRCPITGFNVQGHDDSEKEGTAPVTQFCWACGRTHLIDGATVASGSGRHVGGSIDWELKIGGTVALCSEAGEVVLVTDDRRTPLSADQADVLALALRGLAELRIQLGRLDRQSKAEAGGTLGASRVVAAMEAPTAAQYLLGAATRVVALYDSDDKLVDCNPLYRELRTAIGGDVATGVRWNDLVLASLREGRIPEAAGREEEWLSWRRRQRGRYSVVRRIPDGRSFQVNERRTPDGGIAVAWSDITRIVADRERIERTLRLAEDENVRVLHDIMMRMAWRHGLR